MREEEASLPSWSNTVRFKEALTCRGRWFSGSVFGIGVSVTATPLDPFKQKLKDRKQKWR